MSGFCEDIAVAPVPNRSVVESNDIIIKKSRLQKQSKRSSAVEDNNILCHLSTTLIKNYLLMLFTGTPEDEWKHLSNRAES